MRSRSHLLRFFTLLVDKNGTGHFWGQRLSAIALMFLGLWFAFSMTTMPGFDHADAIAFIAAPVNSVLLLLLSVTLAYHSHLGVEVIIDDYVHGRRIKSMALNFSLIAHLMLTVVAVFAILKTGSGV